MKHNQYKLDFKFIKEPVEFNKYTSHEQLSYCLGANLYMPALRSFADILINNKIPGMTSTVICFEDSIDETDLPKAEANTLKNLKLLLKKNKSGELNNSNTPLIFFRVRSLEQFKKIAQHLQPDFFKIIAGFVFPKFSTKNGNDYFSFLEQLSEKHNEILYGMPVLEGREIAFKETRIAELTGIREVLMKYKNLVLNVRVGGTDISSCFGVRRSIDSSIYDILSVKDCLMDILNFFSRDNEFIVSGPVWEYFLASNTTKFDDTLNFRLHSSLLKGKRLVNEAIDGLLRELIIDKANGFIGKTVIHPSHIKYVNAMHAVTEEEYDDAMQILNTSGGVTKSPRKNKMNEVNPHKNWAEKIYNRSLAYGVIKDETDYIKLVSTKDFRN